MRYLHFLAAVLFFVSCNALDVDEEQPYNHLYTRHRTDRPVAGQTVKDSYIVVLKKGTSREVFAAATGVNAGALAKAEKRFSIGAFNGYAGKYDKKTVQKLKLAPEVRITMFICTLFIQLQVELIFYYMCIGCLRRTKPHRDFHRRRQPSNPKLESPPHLQSHSPHKHLRILQLPHIFILSIQEL